MDGFQPEEIVDDAGWSLLEPGERSYRRGSDESLQEGEDPVGEIGERGKHAAMRILEVLCNGQAETPALPLQSKNAAV